jgi:hypothetical protein
MSEENLNQNNDKSNLPELFTPRQLMNEEDIKKWRVQLENFIQLVSKKPKTIKPPGKFIKVPYVPIDTVQVELDKLFFGLWNWTILFDPKIVVNELMVVGRLDFFHPVALQWLHRDGSGAAQIRMKENTEFWHIENKIQTAIQMDLPHAEAEALKSACAKIGNRFGRNLRRDHQEPASRFFGDEVGPSLTKEQLGLKAELELEIYTWKDIDEIREKKALVLKQAREKLPKEIVTELEAKIQNHFNKLKGKK